MPPTLHRRAFVATAATGLVGAVAPVQASPTDGGPTVAWYRRVETSAALRASLRRDDGTVLLAGETADREPLLLTVTPSGSVRDRRVLPLDRPGEVFALAPTSDGGLLLAGRDPGEPAPLAVKLDADRRVEWTTRPGDEWADDPPFAVAEFESGRYLFASHARSTDACPGYLYALDEEGSLLWRGEDRFGYTHVATMAGLWASSGSAVRFVGGLFHYPEHAHAAVPTVVDDVEPDGTRNGIGELDVEAVLAAPTADGMVTVGHPRDDGGHPDRDRLVLAAHSADGAVTRRSFYGKPPRYRPRSVLGTPDGGIAAVGTADTRRRDVTDTLVLKAGGRGAWTASYVPDSDGIDAHTAVAVAPDRFMVGGRLEGAERGWVALLEGGDGSARVPSSTPTPTPTSTPTPSPTSTPTPSPTSTVSPTPGSPSPTATTSPGLGLASGLAGVGAALLARAVRSARHR